VIVESGADGFKLSWSPDQIKASRKAAWTEATNPDAPKSDIATLKTLEPGQALNLFDAADALRRHLERARLLEDKSDTYKGKPVRLLVIRLELALDEEERKALKTSDAIEKLWLDADGIPIGMDRTIDAKFSKFLIGFKIHEHETREFQRAGGRLVTVLSTKENSRSGFGHREEGHTIFRTIIEIHRLTPFTFPPFLPPLLGLRLRPARTIRQIALCYCAIGGAPSPDSDLLDGSPAEVASGFRAWRT
jgi:hypothetical protein